MLRIQMERLRDPHESGVMLILGSTDWQRLMIYKELLRIDPQLGPLPGQVVPGDALARVLAYMD